MIHYVRMQSFRGVQAGTLSEMTPLTVLVGPNSSGKSTVLDAMMLGGTADLTQAVQAVARRRRAVAAGGPDKRDFESLFYRSSRVAEVAVKGNEGGRRVVIWSQPPNAHVRGFSYDASFAGWDSSLETLASNLGNRAPSDAALTGVSHVELVDSSDLTGSRSLEELYTATSQRGLRREVKDFIKEMLPDVEDIEILVPRNVPTLHLIRESGAVSVGLSGDGVKLLLRIVMVLTATPQTTILLEEPETHMHPGAVRIIANAVFGAVTRGVQVVVTTHSLELVDALTLGRPTGQLDLLSVFRLALDHGALKSSRLSGQEAALARASIEDDLR